MMSVLVGLDGHSCGLGSKDSISGEFADMERRRSLPVDARTLFDLAASTRRMMAVTRTQSRAVMDSLLLCTASSTVSCHRRGPGCCDSSSLFLRNSCWHLVSYEPGFVAWFRECSPGSLRVNDMSYGDCQQN